MMHKLKVAVVKICGFGLAFMPTFTHTLQSQQVDATPIVQRSIAAMGCAALGPDTTATAKGALTLADGTAMPLTIYSQGNNRLRSELDSPKGHKITIVNNGKGQMQHSDGRTEALAENNTSHQRPTHIPCLSNLVLPPGRSDAIAVRVDQVPGDILDVVEITPVNRPHNKQAAERMKTTFWISRSNGFVLRMQYFNTSERDGNDTEIVDVEYSDYRPIDGVAIPFHQITRAGHLVLALQFDSVQLNSAAADFNLR